MKILLGNIFDSKCSTLVNTVNCVGVMGKGIALDFKKKYPGMFDELSDALQRGACKTGAALSLSRPGRQFHYQFSHEGQLAFSL